MSQGGNETPEVRNDFLLDLLTLQQDGKHAISAPTNWTTQPPLLQVTTKVDDIVKDLVESVLTNEGSNEVGRWFFFIGSPGNGKSAAVGDLCRRLIDIKGCTIADQDGDNIEELLPTAIPYALDVYEPGKKYPSVLIVQDASVVRNPYSPDVDPARELVQSLELAWEKGLSLVLCTNRGVLEKAQRDNQTNREINSKPWFRILTAVVGADTQGGIGDEHTFSYGSRTVFRRVLISHYPLDKRSLLESDSLDQLLQRATEPDRWTSCLECSARRMCPFKTNQEWLANDLGRRQVLRLLRRAEVYSGQVIVFREALAIISLILAGCPSDYRSIHPCAWVQEKRSLGDVFSLAARRIYMSLLASSGPRGLDPPGPLQVRQRDALRWLSRFVGADDPAGAALRHVVRSEAPSTDVGANRLLGRHGVMAQLDACREALPLEFYDRWDADVMTSMHENPLVSQIEHSCVGIWQGLEEAIESAASHEAADAHWALGRWSSNYLVHLGASIEGLTSFSAELDEFAELLALVRVPAESRSIGDKRRIRSLDTRLESLFFSVNGDTSTGPQSVRLSEAVLLEGQWVADELRPRIGAANDSGSASLMIRFQGNETATLTAPMFVWLTRRAAGRLDGRCFPPDLLAGASDARVRAAAKSKYAFQPNDVELVVTTEHGTRYHLTRIDSEVDVTT